MIYKIFLKMIIILEEMLNWIYDEWYQQFKTTPWNEKTSHHNWSTRFGNHLFARVFSQHPEVVGWDKLKDNYWVPSDEEPFARYWVYPEELEFPEGDFFLANVMYHSSMMVFVRFLKS